MKVLMNYLLCRNRVADLVRWKAVFTSHREAHRSAGLRLVKLWRSLDAPGNVFFLFEVDNVEKAREFICTPEAAKAGEASGVLDGEYHFMEEIGGY
jgi:hypothetical protein